MQKIGVLIADVKEETLKKILIKNLITKKNIQSAKDISEIKEIIKNSEDKEI